MGSVNCYFLDWLLLFGLLLYFLAFQEPGCSHKVFALFTWTQLVMASSMIRVQGKGPFFLLTNLYIHFFGIRVCFGILGTGLGFGGHIEFWLLGAV